MLSFGSFRRIFVARGTHDMRRGIDALSSVVSSELRENPYSGDCFIFIGKDRKRLKALVYEGSGFWLCLKRLDRGLFDALPIDNSTDARVEMSPAQIHALLEGLVVKVIRKRRRTKGLAIL